MCGWSKHRGGEDAQGCFSSFHKLRLISSMSLSNYAIFSKLFNGSRGTVL